MSNKGCCGGETPTASYSISLSPGCDKGEAWLWMNEAPPDGSEPCTFRLACDGDGGFYVRTGKCGGWKKIGSGTITPGGEVVVDDHTHEQIEINFDGTNYSVVDGVITIPDTRTDPDPVVVPAIKVNGIEVPPVNNCIDLTIPTDTGNGGNGASGVTTISVNGVGVPVDENGNVDITTVLTTADLCSLPVSDSTAPCCNDYVAMCRAVLGTDGQPTGASESVLAPVSHLYGVFEANDYADGLANTCSGQNFYFTDGNGATRLWLNVGVPSGGTASTALEIQTV